MVLHDRRRLGRCAAVGGRRGRGVGPRGRWWRARGVQLRGDLLVVVMVPDGLARGCVRHLLQLWHLLWVLRLGLTGAAAAGNPGCGRIYSTHVQGYYFIDTHITRIFDAAHGSRGSGWGGVGWVEGRGAELGSRTERVSLSVAAQGCHEG